MLEWLYPPRCPVCNKPVIPKGELCHPSCEVKLEYIRGPVCMKCGVLVESETEEYCPECQVRDRGWEKGRSLFYYKGAAGEAMRRVKREGTEEIVRFFAKKLKENRGRFLQEVNPDCIVPVPLHPSKLRQRGFNQSELLAKALGREMNLPVRLLLIKQKKTMDQKRLDRVQRRRNVKDAFAVDMIACGTQIPNRVLLLDDVSTTGSTLTACAGTLKEYGVKHVFFLSVCAGEQVKG